MGERKGTRRELDIGREVARIAGIPDEQVHPSSRLVEDLGLDPFDAAELLDQLARLHGTELDDTGAAGNPRRIARLGHSVRTVEDLERLLVG